VKVLFTNYRELVTPAEAISGFEIATKLAQLDECRPFLFTAEVELKHVAKPSRHSTGSGSVTAG